jgi:hypothetical protein
MIQVREQHALDRHARKADLRQQRMRLSGREPGIDQKKSTSVSIIYHQRGRVASAARRQVGKLKAHS